MIGEQLARIATLVMDTALCPGCGDVIGTNHDCCVECSREVALDVVCEDCGWGAGQNAERCISCLTVAAREDDAR